MIRIKIIAAIMVLVGTLIVISSFAKDNNVLLFLNWGEYIDEEMLDAFEDEYGVTVNMSLGESNEIFYSKVSSGTTVYDVVCPSDYMVEKMYYNGYLEKLDFKRINSFVYPYAISNGIDVENEEEYNVFIDSITSEDVINYVRTYELRNGVNKIYDDMNDNLRKQIVEIDNDEYIDHTIDNYFVPYLWGTWGNMYSTHKDGLEKAVTNDGLPWEKPNDAWACLFDRDVLPKGTKVAMYDSHQHAYYAACRYLGYDTVDELGTTKLSNIKKTVKNMNYNAWGTDNIKKDIVAGNLHLGFMWTGDFLYYYAEQASKIGIDAFRNGDITYDEITTFLRDITNDPFEDPSMAAPSFNQEYDKVYIAEDGSKYDIGFDFYIPDNTIAFCDNLVVTKKARHKDLAYDFINFMMNYTTTVDDKGEKDISSSVTYSNTYYVCYDGPYNDVYDTMCDLANNDIRDWEENEINEYVTSAKKAKNKNKYDTDLYWYMYDYVTGIAFQKYYERDTEKGNILAMFDRKYIRQINSTFNNARV